MLYFAYGSNMSTARLQRRLPGARRLGVASLAGYELRFQVASTMDGSAKADAHHTGDQRTRVLGVLFRIGPEDKAVLDGYEGVGVEYRDAFVTVAKHDGRVERALIYLGIKLDDTLRPYDWYRQHVLHGALENALPEDYLQCIRLVECIADPDAVRSERELSIYRQV